MRKLCVILLMVASGSAFAGEKGQAATKGQAAAKPQAAAKGQAAAKPQAAAKGQAAAKPQAAAKGLISGKLKGRLDLGKIRDRIKKIRG